MNRTKFGVGIIALLFLFLISLFFLHEDEENLFLLIKDKNNIPLDKIFHGYEKVCIQPPYTLKESFEKEIGQKVYFYKMSENKTIFWLLKDGRFRKLYFIASNPSENLSSTCYSIRKNFCLIAKKSTSSDFSDFSIRECNNE